MAEKESITVGDFAARWFRDYAPLRYDGSTLRRYESFYRGIIDARLGGEKIRGLETEEVQGIITEIYQERRYRREAASMEMLIGILKAMLQDAYEYEQLTRYDLSAGIEGHRRVSTPQDPLTEEEIRKLVRMENRPYLEQVIFILMTALKIGMVIRLKHRDVDFEKGIIRLEDRVVYYPRCLERWIGWRNSGGDPRRADEWFFAEEDGAQMREYSFRRGMRRIMEEIGRADCTTEGLRRTAALVSRTYSSAYAQEAVMIAQYGKSLGKEW